VGNTDCATPSGRNRIGCIGTILKRTEDEYAAGSIRPVRRNIYLSLRFCAGLRFRFAIGKWNHASAPPRRRDSYIIIERPIRTRVNSKSRLSRSLGRSRATSTRDRRKNCISAGSRGNQINFNANLLASYRPQSLAFNDVISLANLRGNAGALLSFLARGTSAKHANGGARTTILIAPDSIELQRFIGDFLCISVLRSLYFLRLVEISIDISG